MLPFATEFPTQNFKTSGAFVAEVIAWLRGTTYSTVLDAIGDGDVQKENAHLRAGSGEELRLRELPGSRGLQAIGFRHDLPDDRGRLWRTECVLKYADEPQGQDIIRFRTQCIANVPGAHLETPRKPYLIKSLLKSGLGGLDLNLLVSDQPHWLEDNDKGLGIAKAVAIGEASSWLPMIYVSASDKGGWSVTRSEIEKMAYDLGGIAHVVVEPSRAFSIRLRDASAGRNVYGGTIGVSIPRSGFVKRYYLGWQIENGRALLDAAKAAAARLREQAPTSGWDWLELQERALRLQHDTYKGALRASEADELFNEYVKQLEELQLENRQLKQQISSQFVDALVADDRDHNLDLVRRVGPEIYQGELFDRLRLAAITTISHGESTGLDNRSQEMLKRFVERIPRAPALDELLQDISRSTKDARKMAGDLTDLLCRHGYMSKSENKHIRLEPLPEYVGLSSITVSKTPSENRGLQNQRKQVERTLGIGKLPK